MDLRLGEAKLEDHRQYRRLKSGPLGKAAFTSSKTRDYLEMGQGS